MGIGVVAEHGSRRWLAKAVCTNTYRVLDTRIVHAKDIHDAHDIGRRTIYQTLKHWRWTCIVTAYNSDQEGSDQEEAT